VLNLISLSQNTALIDSDSGQSVTHEQLFHTIDHHSAQLNATPRALIVLYCDISTQCLSALLAAFKSHHVVMLLDHLTKPPLREAIENIYQPTFVWAPATQSFVAIKPAVTEHDAGAKGAEFHPDLKLLLSTSGTTGSSKFVRLTAQNVVENAKSIGTYLKLHPGERAITSLPWHYSFGLSVVTSHLLYGGSLVVCPHSSLKPEFIQSLSEYECTSLAGVPYLYQMLERSGFRSKAPASLKTMTQAGGRLSVELQKVYNEFLTLRGGRFFVMYGQTEATARMSYLPPERLADKYGSVGIAIPGGRFLLENDGTPIKEEHEVGEVFYAGPNVMMGYAESLLDLRKGDECGGKLATGDLGIFDEDGFLILKGRSKRIAKLFGYRLNLDEVERFACESVPSAVLATGEECLTIVHESLVDPNLLRELPRKLSKHFGVNLNAFKLHQVDHFPLLPSGKLDYKSLEVLLAKAGV
jgi:long-chain acyl-CoA synthetase